MKKNENSEVSLYLQEIRAIKDIVEMDNNEIDEGYLEQELEYLELLKQNESIKLKHEKTRKNRDNRYSRKLKTKQKLKALKEKHVYFVSSKESKEGKHYYRRFYLSGCRKYAKKETNKKIRNSRIDFKLNGCAYRRKFDYWNTLF